MLSLILQALYGAVDLMVVGHFGSVASVSAVATGSQVMHAVTVIVTGLTMGVTVALGHSIGAGDEGRAGGIVAGQVKLFSFVAIVFIVVYQSSLPQCHSSMLYFKANGIFLTIPKTMFLWGVSF